MSINIARLIDQLCRGAGHQIVGVSIGDAADKRTWRVSPSSLQAACQPIIDAFDPDDPAHAVAELDSTARDIPRHVRALVLYYLRDKLGRNPSAAERQAAIEALVQAYKDIGP